MSIPEAARAHPWAPRHLDILSGTENLSDDQILKRERGAALRRGEFSGLVSRSVYARAPALQPLVRH